METTSIEKKFSLPIIIVSIVIPIAVAVLFSFKLKDFGIIVEPLSFLPPIYATINGLTAVLLIGGLIAILNKKKAIHKKFMTSAIACSIVFLVMYVAYHLTSESVKFGDSNHDNILDLEELELVSSVRYIYYFILISHIFLSVVVIPFVLFTYVRALSEQFDRHKKLARITYPIWLYVAITGVVVYLMISPYYVK